MFDPGWAAEGHTERVIALFQAWVEAQAIPGLSFEVVREEGEGVYSFDLFSLEFCQMMVDELAGF